MSSDPQTVACPWWCTETSGHIVVDDLGEQSATCAHTRTVATVVGVCQGVPSSATVELDRPDSYHPETGYVRFPEVAILCDAGEVLTPTMARELAAALMEAAELAAGLSRGGSGCPESYGEA